MCAQVIFRETTPFIHTGTNKITYIDLITLYISFLVLKHLKMLLYCRKTEKSVIPIWIHFFTITTKVSLSFHSIRVYTKFRFIHLE
jgi:hypothetical protein